jgi:hypothetical protein
MLDSKHSLLPGKTICFLVNQLILHTVLVKRKDQECLQLFLGIDIKVKLGLQLNKVMGKTSGITSIQLLGNRSYKNRMVLK